MGSVTNTHDWVGRVLLLLVAVLLSTLVALQVVGMQRASDDRAIAECRDEVLANVAAFGFADKDSPHATALLRGALRGCERGSYRRSVLARQ